jgi:hypothetical protein
MLIIMIPDLPCIPRAATSPGLPLPREKEGEDREGDVFFKFSRSIPQILSQYVS